MERMIATLNTLDTLNTVDTNTKLFFTDWEGPWITTDFALEISNRILGNQRFFERLSQYDDYLYYIKKMKDYYAGDTLKLLAPFIAAHDVNSSKLEKLAKETANYVPDAEKAISILQEKFKPVVISTSYIQYLETTAKKIGVEGYLYGTEFDVERFSSIFNEKDRLEAENIVEKISKMPEIRIDVENRRVISGFETISFLDGIFWGESGFTRKVQEIMKEIEVIGGKRKLEIVKRYSSATKNLIAIGDSISDFEMLGWVKGKGLAVSFNGNEYSLMRSNLAIISDSAFSEAAVIESFILLGLDGVKRLIDLYTSMKEKEKIYELIDERIADGLMNSKTIFQWIDGDYLSILADSLRMRKTLRGEAGKLG